MAAACKAATGAGAGAGKVGAAGGVENGPVTAAACAARRAVAAACLTCASYRTAVGTGVAGAVGGRLTDPFASSLACRTVAAA